LQTLKALHEALNAGLRKGALIHEKSGATHPVEVLEAEDDRLIAVVRCGDEQAKIRPDARVRVELPRENSVVLIQGRVREARHQDGLLELEMSCPGGAEERQRRMDVRIDADCRIRVGADGAWEETRTVNLSAGGALIVSHSQARVGEVVDVELDLGGHPIRCRAEVVRRGVKTTGAPSRTSAALKFIGLSDELRQTVAVYVLGRQAGEKLRQRK
jgi:c-di-GMP-binding flagellar brake protein YcgR